MTNFLEDLRAIVGTENVHDDDKTKLATNSPWRHGKANSDYLAVVIANDYEKISEVLKYCDQNNIKIVPRSGGTALTNGSSIDKSRPDGTYIILKLYNDNEIREPRISKDGDTARIFPGNTSKQVNELLKLHNRRIAVDLGIGDKEGKAQLLGYIATNAAGSGAAFKGRTKDIVKSVTVATIDGEIYKIPHQNPQAPTLDEVVGMGGISCIILEAEIETTIITQKSQVAVVRVNELSKMHDLLERFKENCWDNMNLFERVNSELFEEVVVYTERENHDETKKLRDLGDGDYLFIELTCDQEDADLKIPLIRSLKEADLFYDAVIDIDNEFGDFWLSYRIVNASVACDNYAKKTQGKVLSFDLSLPPGDEKEFPSTELAERIKEMAPGIKLFSFGHAAGVEKIEKDTPRGGTAMHFNPVLSDELYESMGPYITIRIFAEVTRRGGEIVSEHTAGTKLTQFVKDFTPKKYQEYLDIKKKHDPKCTLNPDAYVFMKDVLTNH